jgi:RNA polymerase sigma-70 factor (ECF subfamily)
VDPSTVASEIRAPQPDSLSPAGGFAHVVESHWTAVFRFLLAMTGNHHDTEELTQETFLRALRRMDSFEPGTQLRSWLLRIAANACRDVWRKRSRGRCEPLAADPPGPASDPQTRLETLEQAQLLRVAMEELSDTTRAVFHLRVQEALPFRQIGEMLDLSEDAARWHMHQARTKLMARVESD